MQLLASRSIREGIIASQDQEMAARMMLADSSGLSPKAVVDDARLVFDGRVAPSLLWSKHPQAIVAAGLLGLIVLAWFARLFRRRRPAQASESKT